MSTLASLIGYAYSDDEGTEKGGEDNGGAIEEQEDDNQSAFARVAQYEDEPPNPSSVRLFYLFHKATN